MQNNSSHSHQNNKGSEPEEEFQRQQDNEEQYFSGQDDEEDLMEDHEGDVASEDSSLQVQDPSQEMWNEQQDGVQGEAESDDPMREYYEKEGAVLQWLHNNPGQKWVDKDFPTNNTQFYENSANVPQWSPVLKNVEWRRPDEIIKDPKFIIHQDEKGIKSIDVDAKHGVFAASWFVGALSIIGSKSHLLQKLIIQKQYFEKGFVSFQFFKNGKWTQVMVDTLLPYQKEQNNRVCVYSACLNPEQFWIQLMEKAYVKLHGNYERITKGNVLEGMVDLTGGIGEAVELQSKFQKKDVGALWNVLYAYLQQKFLLGAINSVEYRGLKNAQQGQLGILQNHYYTIIDMRDYPKDNLKLIRVRNPWGNEGVWTGPFCQEADDWQKYKNVKEDTKHVTKTKKSDGSWWMSITDFIIQFDHVMVNKVFPENWEIYSVQSQWNAKTNGGKCPTGLNLQKATFSLDTKQLLKTLSVHSQPQSDDKWFTNPQFRIKVKKDTKMYISLMLEDQKISNQPYVSCGFMIAAAKSKNQRFWERPAQADIVAEVNYHGHIASQREITHFITLKKTEKNTGLYMIVPNINDTKESFKKDETRKFYLRLFSADAIDVAELPETLELTVQGQWNQSSAGGSRKIQIKQDGNGKKKGNIKDNPNWCKNPQYFLSIKQPTILKIILRKAGNKKYKGWKIGMTINRYEMLEQKKIEKQVKKDKKNAGNNLIRLIQQTNEFLQPPIINQVQRKLLIEPHQKFKQSCYLNEQHSALFFKWNPTEGPFIIIPSSDGEQRYFGYKLSIFSNNPVEMIRLDQSKNQAIIGRWEKDISAGGCHLNQKDREPSQRTWSMNPKYHLSFKEEEGIWDEPLTLKITLCIAQKNWKKLNPNTVSGMIGLYLLQKREGKLSYSRDVVIRQTNFLPAKSISLQVTLGVQKPLLKGGYLIMPSTYESKIQGSFILSVKCDRPFEFVQSK